MVVLGYLAECFSKRDNNESPSANNTLNSVIFEDPSCLHYHLRKLSYIGPLVMAIGAFGIIVSCVVVCETRYGIIFWLKIFLLSFCTHFGCLTLF